MMIPLFLCYFNSIARVFTTAAELTLLAIICWAVFGTPLDLITCTTILIVSVATILYLRNPVVTETENCENRYHKQIVLEDSNIQYNFCPFAAQPETHENALIVEAKL